MNEKNDCLYLYYDHPAEIWEETLPIGNGSLGGMIWGGIGEELIGLNEESLWSGYEREKNNPRAFDSLSKVRELIFSGKNAEAEQLIQDTMLGEYNESYLPLGILHLAYGNLTQKSVQNYERRLNLDTATATTDFDAEQVHFHREIFASYPGKAIVLKLTAERPVMKVTVWLESELNCTFAGERNTLHFSGQCPEHVDPSYIRGGEEAVIWGSRGKRFAGKISVAACDGKLVTDDAGIRIEDASEIVLTIEAVMPSSLKGSYEDWKTEHIRDYQSIYQKVELYLGPQKPKPTDERLQELKCGGEDNGLFALYFQYGRYLMIASSRKGSLPANLQGIWSWEFQAPWSCNWTTNINLEMNYWPALSCGLEDCLEPYFSFVEKLVQNGKRTAEINYHCRGAVHHHNADGWYSTNPTGIAFGEESGREGSVVWSMWPMGMAWLCQEFYYYYEYSKDLDFLRERAYPVLREAALFLTDWLVLYQGKYVTCPSTSPENRFFDEEGRKCCVTMASAMDLELTQEVFEHYISACHILGIEEPLVSEVENKLKHLQPVQTGSFGQILEWYEEYPEAEPGHRHLSHLYGMYPSELWAGNEKLEKAAAVSLEYRLQNGGGYTGWSCAWIINLMAILGDGEGAWHYLHTLLTRSTYPNLWDAHEPFQIDGNFGGIAGIANMLVQDRGGCVKVLPALPKQFSDGYVKGIRIKDNKVVDLFWKDGKLVRVNEHKTKETERNET